MPSTKVPSQACGAQTDKTTKIIMHDDANINNDNDDYDHDDHDDAHNDVKDDAKVSNYNKSKNNKVKTTKIK